MPDPEITEERSLLAVIGGPIETTSDAIREEALLRAIAEVVKTRRAALKAFVGQHRPGWKTETDLGSALVTSPSRRPTIVDEDAFLAWAIETHPEATRTVERLNTTPIADALDGRFDEDDPEADPLSDVLRELLDGIPGAITRSTIVEESLPKRVTDSSVALEREDGTVVDRETGEVIPGVEVVAASSPSPRITPDKSTVEALVEEITSRLGPITQEDTA